MTEHVTPPSQSSDRSLLVRGIVGVVLAVLGNVALVVAVGALGIAPEFRALTVPPVAFLSVVGAVGAAVVYWLLPQFVSDADSAFRRIASVVLVLSFVPDIALLAFDPAATPVGVVILMLMHVVVAAAAVWALVYWGRSPSWASPA